MGREDREAELDDEADVPAAAVEHAARNAAGGERGHGELAEMRGDRLIARVDGDVSGRNLAEHLQHLAERGVVRRVLDRLPAHGERRPGEPHPSLERADRGRQGLRPVAAGVEDVRQRGRVDRIESLPECGGPFHSASVSFTVALNAT